MKPRLPARPSGSGRRTTMLEVARSARSEQARLALAEHHCDCRVAHCDCRVVSVCPARPASVIQFALFG